MKTIDINCDLGEGFGAYTMGDDDGMLGVVSTVNLACGFHGGDPSIMMHVCSEAKKRGVAVGAHPGYPDLWGFGRRDIPFSIKELKELLAYQIGATIGMATLAGHRVTHVKPHGAMGHRVCDHADAAQALIDVVKAFDSKLLISVMANSMLEKMCKEQGVPVAHEIYADRAYMDDGRLMPRSQPGSVIHDAEESVKRVLQMVSEQALISHTGKRIPVDIDTVCVHGDTAGAVGIAQRIRGALEEAGFKVAPYSDTKAA